MNLILVFSYIGIPMEVTIKANTGVIRVQMRSDAQQLDYTSENLFPFTCLLYTSDAADEL